jgi:hypothetical protein
MALDSVPPYPCDLGSSSRAAATARTQQRIRYAASSVDSSLPHRREFQSASRCLLFLNFCLFCKKTKSAGKMSAPGPRTLTRRTTTDTSGGSTARRSSPTPTSPGSSRSFIAPLAYNLLFPQISVFCFSYVYRRRSIY